MEQFQRIMNVFATLAGMMMGNFYFVQVVIKHVNNVSTAQFLHALIAIKVNLEAWGWPPLHLWDHVGASQSNTPPGTPHNECDWLGPPRATEPHGSSKTKVFLTVLAQPVH